MTGGGGSPGPDSFEADARLTLRYQDGEWSGRCVWTHAERVDLEDENGEPFTTWDNESGTEDVSFAPLQERTDVRVGDTVTIEVIGVRCGRGPLYGDIPVVERTAHSAPRQPDGSDSWYAAIEYEWPGAAYAFWDTKTGLVLAWRDAGHYSAWDGWMVDTDAPLS